MHLTNRVTPSAGGALLSTATPLETTAVRCRTSPNPGDPSELSLTAAAERGRGGAIRRVDSDLAGLDVARLRDSMGSTTTRLLEVAPSLLEELDAEVAIDRALMATHCVDGHFRVADGTRRTPVPGTEFLVRRTRGDSDLARIRPVAAVDAMERGVTLIANNLADRVGGRLARLMSDLGRAAGAGVGVNAYISERGARGFGRHWDDHDVVIVQCRGSKKWTLFEPLTLAPLKGYVPREEFGKATFTTVLRPGDGLYIPRGWSHEVSGFPGTVSFHYTISIRPPHRR